MITLNRIDCISDPGNIQTSCEPIGLKINTLTVHIALLDKVMSRNQ